MTKPRHGKLRLSSLQQWIFTSSNSVDLYKGIILEDLPSTFHNLLGTGQLFKGHTKFQQVYNTRTQVQLRDSVLRHVSAHGLTSLLAPVSLNSHHKMNASDKVIWDEAYNEEFDGLTSLPTWEVLTESQFKSLSKGVKALPSMAIVTIKYDALNRPKHAKYRIVVLGNHDYHTWLKESTTAPVMLQLELCLLTALAVSQCRFLKNCDIKQAFVQSSLLDAEHYFVKPPKGCPRSLPGTYWKLLRSLYGLHRAPKLWYEKLSLHLRPMGLKQSPTSPLLFIGHLIEVSPPMYMGIYVDDIIYFRASDTVEQCCESKLSTIGNVDFMGNVTHFLGIEFTWSDLPDGHLSVNLTQQLFVLYIHLLIIRVFILILFFLMKCLRKLVIIYGCSTSPFGSLNWLAHTTRPDLSTIVSLLAQHQSTPSVGHYEAALYVAKFLATT
jgi:hypothetical protein